MALAGDPGLARDRVAAEDCGARVPHLRAHVRAVGGPLGRVAPGRERERVRQAADVRERDARDLGAVLDGRGAGQRADDAD